LKHYRYPPFIVGGSEVRIEDMVEIPAHKDLKSLTIQFLDHDFEYIKKYGWCLKEKQSFGHERHEPYEIRKDLLLKKIPDFS
jgi:hypothetical protein